VDRTGEAESIPIKATLKNQIYLGLIMAGSASPEDSEPLFVLEPLPELSGVIESFGASNPLFLIIGFGSALFLLTRFEDPLQKLWTTSLGAIGFNYFVTESLFYTMIFTSVYILGFVVVWTAIRWEDLKAWLGIDRARILSIVSFIICTWILVVLGTAIGMPAGPGIVICGLTTAYLWWTYYSLEPARA